ncbi:DUF1540 domain-containing protein [Nakamurella aerolata]|uniref:DUF1540 domain-containing protein n=1 Tax=Nakamurella aerolata TaxID=1656892 RepID=A0A849AB90_9ACTN|nr:DUF1540 domain-containing protein [Nakamurella aerolata]NNG36408.1 DUF1540 domain-containing protein [Nakamurella aerolata]
MSTLSLPLVSACSVEGCSYNHDHDCHAGAITVTGASSACGTYVDTADKGGVNGQASAMVGACHRSDCVHNSHLECSASNVEVGPGADRADCLTFALA